MLAHGEGGGGREGKGIGKPGFRTEDRQTTTQTVTCPRQPPTPCSLPDIPINHVGTPLLELQFVFHPALRSWPCGEVCWLFCFFRGPRPGCSWEGTLAPDMGQTQPQMLRRQGGQMGNNPHSHTLGSELAWLLPSCGMTSFWREIRSASPSLG